MKEWYYNMHASEMIKYPILTEKTYSQMENGVYTFAVNKRVNKAQLKKIVEFIFECKVAKINIMTIRKKEKRVGRFVGEKSGYKKAIVILKEGHIKLFEDEKAKEINIDEKNQKTNDSKAKLIEEKVAARIKEKTALKNLNDNKTNSVNEIEKSKGDK